uniref:Uncharacterized protein n=1 Tax=Knipowitschia caucasica TaxID=637954 RepID=A0AAV2JMN7_KNICA
MNLSLLNAPSFLVKDQRLHWTTFYTGPPSTLDHRLHWTTVYTGPPSTLDHRLHWTTFYTGPPSTLDHLLHWTIVYTGPPSTLNHLLVKVAGFRSNRLKVALDHRGQGLGFGTPTAVSIISAVQQQDYSASVWLRRRDKLEHLWGA